MLLLGARLQEPPEFTSRDEVVLATSAKKRISRAMRVVIWLTLPAYFVIVATQTTFLEGIYVATIRDMYFGCMEFIAQKYAYRMIPGKCRLSNLEYDSTMTHDRAGFRNATEMPAPQIAVLGDSHAYGHGVNDDETFSALLSRGLGVPVRNLALPAFATRRAVEAYKAEGLTADVIVMQYCDNDLDENIASLKMTESEYQIALRTRLATVIKNYHYTKSKSGFRQWIMTLGYATRGLVDARFYRFTRYAPDEGTLNQEADAFARLISEYHSLLAGKTVILIESSGWGRNRRGFQKVFSRHLHDIAKVDWVVLDSHALLTRTDYFRLDDHLNAKGHGKIAGLLSDTVRQRLLRTNPAPHAFLDLGPTVRRQQ